MDRWSFVQDLCGAWLWRCVGRLRVRQSRHRFSTLPAAMEDAERHGLVPGKSRLGSITRRTAVRRRLLACVPLLFTSATPSLIKWCAQALAMV
ncbi:MAG: hypothetical protein V7640_3030 [Betaproteobacteria bacterium]|jgi:hypothetical protein